MEITTHIQYDEEEIECITILKENKESWYVFLQNNQTTQDIDKLNISNNFKDKLRITNIVEMIIESIPYTKCINGLKFEFDFKEFKQNLNEANILGEWNRIKETYGGDVILLEKGLITKEKIINAYKEEEG